MSSTSRKKAPESKPCQNNVTFLKIGLSLIYIGKKKIIF